MVLRAPKSEKKILMTDQGRENRAAGKKKSVAGSFFVIYLFIDLIDG